ncbi:RAQPRD family integrative conjugative element protein [Dickeya dianthicola]|uniref:integrative conjugative element protein, RAQPRD family n=1 Tax=Dickeya dianthicola TaxID=204039 RepID=UPI001F60875A|nr:RAQPRD family integrative conjugative element protein [Dickeya dianthicola]MCI4231536.1 RAQPRD family integrative conjugative element protein [Dickeya dianthicola]
MALSFWTARFNAILPVFALLGLIPQAIAESAPTQRQELAATLRQLEALQRFVAQSAATTPPVPNERYYFDYPRLLGDLARVRSGIQFYLSPSRAQPRDTTELNSDYRQESPPKYHSTSLKLKDQP